VTDRDIDAVAREIRECVARDDLQVDVRAGLPELREARNEPRGCEERRDAHRQHAAVGGARHALRRIGDLPECVAHRRQVVAAGGREQDAAVDALEQLHAEMRLERADHLAHRAGRDRQLLGGCLHRQVAGSRFECAQRVERRQAGTNHSVFLNRKSDEISFETIRTHEYR
jgi:hypothetical protein